MNKLSLIIGGSLVLLATGCNSSLAVVHKNQTVVESPVPASTPEVLGASVVAPDPVVSVTPDAPVTPKATTRVNVTPIVTDTSKQGAQAAAGVQEQQDLAAQAQVAADAQAKANAEQKDKNIAQQAASDAQAAKARANEEAAAKANLAAAYYAECTSPINVLNKNILDLQTKYNADVLAKQQEITNANGGVNFSYYLIAAQESVPSINSQVQADNLQIQQIQLTCSAKYGN